MNVQLKEVQELAKAIDAKFADVQDVRPLVVRPVSIGTRDENTLKVLGTGHVRHHGHRNISCILL